MFPNLTILLTKASGLGEPSQVPQPTCFCLSQTNLAMLEDPNTRVGGSQVNADCSLLCHCFDTKSFFLEHKTNQANCKEFKDLKGLRVQPLVWARQE